LLILLPKVRRRVLPQTKLKGRARWGQILSDPHARTPVTKTSAPLSTSTPVPTRPGPTPTPTPALRPWADFDDHFTKTKDRKTSDPEIFPPSAPLLLLYSIIFSWPGLTGFLPGFCCPPLIFFIFFHLFSSSFCSLSSSLHLLTPGLNIDLDLTLFHLISSCFIFISSCFSSHFFLPFPSDLFICIFQSSLLSPHQPSPLFSPFSTLFPDVIHIPNISFSGNFLFKKFSCEIIKKVAKSRFLRNRLLLFLLHLFPSRHYSSYLLPPP